MSSLHILYDPTDRLEIEPELVRLGVKVARLPIPDDLEGRDIYEVARKLAELLLEQINR